MMNRVLFVALGGALGSVARYLLSDWAQRVGNGLFPWGTVTVNLLGSLVLGALWAFFERFVVSPNLRVFLMIGLLGGFTTFSTFTLEALTLLQDGETKMALANIGLSVVGGVGLAIVGYLLMRAALSSSP